MSAYLDVHVDDGDWFHVDPKDEGAIDAAVERWVASVGHADTLLDLTLRNGDTLRVKASTIKRWIHSTADGRMRGVEIDRDSEAEHKQNRANAGLFGDED
jgi:hypothetical protein